MTIAGVAAGALAGRVGTNRPRLAAPGAVLLAGGLLILWWGLGIFRGESGADGLPRIMRRRTGPIPGKGDGDDNPAGGGGSAKLQ